MMGGVPSTYNSLQDIQWIDISTVVFVLVEHLSLSDPQNKYNHSLQMYTFSI